MRPSENPMVKARTTETRSPYNRVVTLVLWFFLGMAGVHRFYVGKFATGLLMLLTGGGFGIWWIFDLILILTGRFRDAEGRVLGPPQVEYQQLPSANDELERKRRQKVLENRHEPELAPLPDGEPDLDDEVMRDPLEDEFAKLEQEMKQKG